MTSETPLTKAFLISSFAVSIVAERLSAQFSVYRPVTELFLVYIQSAKVDEAKQLLQVSFLTSG